MVMNVKAGVVLLVLMMAGAAGHQKADDQPPTKPERVEIKGVENVFRLSPRLYSGGDARGKEALTAIKQLGVKTLISVDGSTPDVETAKALGLRYVHLPIGYGTVTHDRVTQIIKAMNTLPGPFYVHCHHGQHRGPAAAAVCGVAIEGWSRPQAVAWMEQAGTDRRYQGLYDAARTFKLPTKGELDKVSAELPERAKVPALVEIMVAIDQHWDHIKAIRAAGYRTPDDQPDLDPPHEALQLVELFREASRLADAPARGARFASDLEKAVKDAESLETALRSKDLKGADGAFKKVDARCMACHTEHRNTSK